MAGMAVSSTSAMASRRVWQKITGQSQGARTRIGSGTGWHTPAIVAGFDSRERCPSPLADVRKKNYRISSSATTYTGFILAFASSIHNKQTSASSLSHVFLLPILKKDQ
jgi:hypothetical protein